MGSLRTVATVAAVSLLLQGVVWTILSLLGILAFSCHFQPKEDMSNNPSFTAMVLYYFSDTSCWSSQPDRIKAGITSSNNIALISSFQFAFNFLMSFVSLILIFVIPRKSSTTFLGWLYSFLFLGFAVCVTDMVTATTFSNDKNIVSGTSATNNLAPLAQMLLLISLLAARGYVYWVLNVSILLYIFIAATMRLFKACKKIDEEKNLRNGHVNNAYEEDERGLPAHTAVSRWPGVGKSLWRYYRNPEQVEPKPRDNIDQESVHRDRSGFGTRQELTQRPSFRDAFNYMEPKRRWQEDEIRREDPRTLPAPKRPQRRDSAQTRPNSLQEAILTIKPLRQVRPKLTEMQNRY